MSWTTNSSNNPQNPILLDADDKHVNTAAKPWQHTVIKRIIGQMGRPQSNYTPMRLESGTEVRLTDAILRSFYPGKHFTEAAWKLLIRLFILKRVPELKIYVGDKIPDNIEPEDKIFWLKKKVSTDDSQPWYLVTFEKGKNNVQTYIVRHGYPAYAAFTPVLAKLIGIEAQKLQMLTHTEFAPGFPPAFEDAILLDMLLDIATGVFVPWTRTESGGAEFLKEILDQLCDKQIEAEKAKSPTSKRKVPPLADRLSIKKLKSEP